MRERERKVERKRKRAPMHVGTNFSLSQTLESTKHAFLSGTYRISHLHFRCRRQARRREAAEWLGRAGQEGGTTSGGALNALSGSSSSSWQAAGSNAEKCLHPAAYCLPDIHIECSCRREEEDDDDDDRHRMIMRHGVVHTHIHTRTAAPGVSVMAKLI